VLILWILGGSETVICVRGMLMEFDFQEIYAQQDIYEMTDLLSQALQMPVIIETAAFDLISYSSLYMDNFDQANQLTILSKKHPDKILKRFHKEGIVKRLKTSVHPFRVKQIEEIGLNQRLVVPARYQSEIMAYIWIQEAGSELTDEQILMLKQVAVHVGQIIHRRNLTEQAHEGALDRFYWNLIQGVYADERTIRKEAEALQVLLPKSLAVVVFRLTVVDEQAAWEAFVGTAKSYLRDQRACSFLLTGQSQIIALLGTNADPATDRMRPTQIVDHLLSLASYPASMILGIGNTYLDIMSYQRSYLEALEVINVKEFIGKTGSVPREYSNLGVLRYLEVISIGNKTKHYVNDNLQILNKKDQANQSELIKTLKMYLEQNCKLKQTAEALFIHPNTLQYRLKQILDYTSIDFSNFNLKCQLYIDLNIMEHYENKDNV
jgi:DNA-binding PucR family transcriptional regulator